MQLDEDTVKENLLYETPGTLIKFALISENLNIDSYEKNLKNIYYLIEKTESEKDSKKYTFLFLLL